ncbi:MAG: 30S ribosomal protein S14 [Coxiellaceae bacterium]|nr:MAG: 30S ribosomal protein S14 [Coxiellaceae bacterium]
MAKLSMIGRELRRIKSSSRAKNARNKLRDLIKDQTINFDEKATLVDKLSKRPRDESPVRVQRRCKSCGRTHAVYRKFGLCRLCLRIVAMRGDVPGLVKSSW